MIEAPGPQGLVGAAIKGSSHYVVTGYDGLPSKTAIFDELVIANEFSIAPAFILTISKKTKKSLLQNYSKKATQFQTNKHGPDDKILQNSDLHKIAIFISN